MKKAVWISALIISLSLTINSCSTCGHCENDKGQWTTYKYCRYNSKTIYNDAVAECQNSGGYWVLNASVRQ